MKQRPRLGIYIHIPFCASKCGYCDFYSLAGCDNLMEKYHRALIAHLEESGPSIRDYEVDTVYFGGGTPSYYGAERLMELFNVLKLNGKSANNDLLKIIGRRHNFRQAQDAFQMAREAGFDNISVDLIYGLPTQTKSDWAESVQKILEMHPEHISCYGLKLEEGTPMYEEYLNSPVLPDDDEQADMYFYAAETLARYGYEQYEISNFAARGFESRHNLKYWNLDDYMGFGPGAASSVGKLRYSYIKDLKRYISCVRRRTSLVEEYEELSTLERSVEYIMLGMRTSRGISENDYRERAQSSWQAIYRVLLAFQEKGWVEQTGDRWHFTVPGYLISNTLIGILLEAQAAGRVENIPWLARGDRAEKPLSMPKSEDEIFAEMYEQTKANAD